MAEALEPACTWLESTQPTPVEALAHLLRTAIWGNQADLSVWPEGEEKPEPPARTS